MTASRPEPHTRAAIVRHPEHPQWGPGYVIRVTKTGADVFFHWGGKRKVPTTDPLEPTQLARAELELFELCAGLSTRSWSRGHHSIYAIELDPAVMGRRAFRERNPGGAASG